MELSAGLDTKSSNLIKAGHSCRRKQVLSAQRKLTLEGWLWAHALDAELGNLLLLKNFPGPGLWPELACQDI